MEDVADAIASFGDAMNAFQDPIVTDREPWGRSHRPFWEIVLNPSEEIGSFPINKVRGTKPSSVLENRPHLVRGNCVVGA